MELVSQSTFICKGKVIYLQVLSTLTRIHYHLPRGERNGLGRREKRPKKNNREEGERKAKNQAGGRNKQKI